MGASHACPPGVASAALWGADLQVSSTQPDPGFRRHSPVSALGSRGDTDRVGTAPPTLLAFAPHQALGIRCPLAPHTHSSHERGCC